MTENQTASKTALGREHVHAMLKEIPAVMLVTSETQTTMEDLSGARARPMGVARVEDDCTLWFLTALDSPKVEEAMSTGDGLVTGQTKTRFVSLRGNFELSRDRGKIDEVWSATAKAWFPQGKEDPNIAVLIFRPTEAEVWDMSGVRGLSYVFEAAKAVLQGKKVESGSREQHERVSLGR